MARSPLPASDGRVDVVVPAHNEARIIEANVDRLHAHLSSALPRPWRIVIAENASTDETLEVAKRLALRSEHVDVLHLDEPGRGRALKAAWSASDAPLLAYMDADLSTDLAGVVPLIDTIASGRADVAIGSRLISGASVTRSFGREAISRSYNAVVRTTFRAPFHDAQCGFKAITAAAATALLPHVRDDGWFFDTELLLVALRHDLEVVELPVRWVEDPDSSVRLLSTAVADLRGLARMATQRR